MHLDNAWIMEEWEGGFQMGVAEIQKMSPSTTGRCSRHAGTGARHGDTAANHNSTNFFDVVNRTFTVYSFF